MGCSAVVSFGGGCVIVLIGYLFVQPLTHAQLGVYGHLTDLYVVAMCGIAGWGHGVQVL